MDSLYFGKSELLDPKLLGIVNGKPLKEVKDLF